MTMIRSNTLRLARAGALGALLLAASFGLATQARAADAKDAAKEPKCEASKKFQEKYKVASEASTKQDWATALSGAKDAFAEAKLPCEQMYAVSIQRAAAYNLKDNAELMAAAERMNTVPGVTDKDRLTNLQVIYQTLIQAKDYDKAIPALKSYIAAKGDDPEMYDLLGRLEYQQKDCVGAIDALDKAAKSKAATEQQLLMEQDCHYRNKDTARQAAATEELLKRFPKESYLYGVLALYQEKDELQLLNLYRIGFAKGFLVRQPQVIDYANSADRAGISAEAQRVLEKGAAEKWITLDDKNTKMLASEKRSAAEDKKLLPALDKEARAGTSGKKDIAVGYAYFGLEDYASAVEAIRRGLTRAGDVKRVDDANMVLGISLARLKRYDEAEAAFNAAKADPRMQKAAEIWIALMKD